MGNYIAHVKLSEINQQNKQELLTVINCSWVSAICYNVVVHQYQILGNICFVITLLICMSPIIALKLAYCMEKHLSYVCNIIG